MKNVKVILIALVTIVSMNSCNKADDSVSTLTGGLLKTETVESVVITIRVAPSVLSLQNQGEVVTVHTDIAYNLVAGSTVTLNGIAISWWKSDDRGNFVAKFLTSEVQNLPGLVIGGYNLLTLSGTTKTGVNFTGSKEVKVINVIKR